MIEFKTLVEKYVRGECSEAEKDILKSNIREWLNELNMLSRDVEIQLAAQKARIAARHAELLEIGSKAEWLSYKAEEANWTLGALRFKASVERCIHEVKTLRAQQHEVLAGV